MSNDDAADVWPVPDTFTHRMIGRSMSHFAELRGEIDALNEEHLDFILGMWIVADLLQKKELDIPEKYQILLAADLLQFYMGQEWTSAHVFPNDAALFPQYETGRRYLRTGGDSADDRFRWQQRVLNLASMLYNLQHVPGIQHRISTLHSCDLESAIGELECAASLSDPSHDLRFIVPVGRKGSDYEAEVRTSAGRTVYCEIKTKTESTTLSEQTIWSTCEKARKQLPKGQPGLIFLRIPEAWVEIPGAKPLINRAIDKALRQSSRLVGIIVAWEVWEYYGAGRAVYYMYSATLNERSPLFSDDIRELVEGRPGRIRPGWVELQPWLMARLPQLASSIQHCFNCTHAPGDPSDGRPRTVDC